MTPRVAIFLSLLLLPLLANGQPGNTGLSFLKMGLTGREIGMGEAGGANASGAAAAYYNPAGMFTRAGESQILFTHRSWIEGTSFDHLAAAIALGPADAVGAAVSTIAIPDVAIRLRPGEPEGSFTARNFAGTLSYARRLSDDVTAGVSAKILYEKILIDEATGFAADLGFRYDTGFRGVKVGVALSNIGSMNSLRSEATPLPLLFRAGGTMDLDIAEGELAGTIATDVVKVFKERDPLLNVGGELFWRGMAGLRGGYQFGSSGRGLTAGLGIRYGTMGFDYAYSRLAAGLGDGHAFTLALEF